MYSGVCKDCNPFRRTLFALRYKEIKNKEQIKKCTEIKREKNTAAMQCSFNTCQILAIKDIMRHKCLEGTTYNVLVGLL